MTEDQHDPFFNVEESASYKRDLLYARVHILDGSHDLLSDQGWQKAGSIFMERQMHAVRGNPLRIRETGIYGRRRDQVSR